MRKWLLISCNTTIDREWIARWGDAPARWARCLGIDQREISEVQAGLGEALPDPQPYDGIIVGGSPHMVDEDQPWMWHLAAWLRHVLANYPGPLWAVCFGHQILAHACGGTVGEMPRPGEYGSRLLTLDPQACADDPLFVGMPSQFIVQESHRQRVLHPPPCAQSLGTSPDDDHHLLRYGPLQWSSQYHPEFTAPYMRALLAHRRSQVSAQGNDVAHLMSTVRESDESAAIMRRLSGLASATAHPSPVG